MKLISVVHEGLGCDYHRIHLPSIFFNVFERGNVDDVDVIFFNRHTDFLDLADYKRRGVKLVMDLDDYWILPFSHPQYHQQKEFAEKITRNLKLADGVITTNKLLASKILQYNKNVIVCPNALPLGHLQFKKERGNGTHVLYTGGMSHLEDLKLLKNVQIPSFALVGNEHDAEFRKMKSLFPISKTITPLSLDKYMSIYKYGRMAMAPLVNNEFNQHKSNLKLLEAAIYELPVICSPVIPYLENSPPVLYANSTQEWTKHFNSKISQEIGKELLAWSKEFHNFEKINQDRIDFIQNI